MRIGIAIAAMLMLLACGKDKPTETTTVENNNPPPETSTGPHAPKLRGIFVKLEAYSWAIFDIINDGNAHAVSVRLYVDFTDRDGGTNRVIHETLQTILACGGKLTVVISTESSTKMVSAKIADATFKSSTPYDCP